MLWDADYQAGVGEHPGPDKMLCLQLFAILPCWRSLLLRQTEGQDAKWDPVSDPYFSSLVLLVTPPIWGKQLGGCTKFIEPYSEAGYLNQ